MQQLTQQLKSGKMEILEVPFPALNRGHIMVRNHYSVISAGTEGKTVTDARKNYVQKAKSRQKEVKQVIEQIKTNGLLSTYKLVMNKLEAPSALGYSCAGEVIAIGDEVTEFKVGDFVACGGATASHADVVSVPVNLAVKVPESVDLKQAAFSTIASVAIQGIRQTEMQMGENCLIIGMGIIGQITYKILEASGINPIGIDISQDQVDQSLSAGIENVYNRNQPGIEELIMNFTNGYGADSIIITAATSSLDPVEFAGAMARKKAKVVVVGAVPTGFSRANYYKKELDLRMSSSYGPGRSDVNYEEKGHDYPIGYVRWTENRNMQSFVRLLSTDRLDISKLISHTFKLEDAPKAYDMILERNEPFAGILIKYEEYADLKKQVTLNKRENKPENVNVGFIGAGSFAQGYLLPNMKKYSNFIGVATGRGNTAKYVGDKYKFNYCAASADEIVSDKNINTVFITTRHNLHAEYVLKAIKNGKNVFVEKPLAMNINELNEIKEAYENSSQKHLMVGFNRRFSPAVKRVKELFSDKQVKSINIRINAGNMPKEHWVNDPDIGGGRIIGEGCHFIDLAMYLAGSKITSVYANSMTDSNNLNNTVNINLNFENGSIANVSYFSNGNKKLPKEFIEIFCGGTVAQIDDFKRLAIFDKNIKKFKFKGQDKGHAKEVESYLFSIRYGKSCPISFEDCYISSYVTLMINESLKSKRVIKIQNEYS